MNGDRFKTSTNYFESNVSENETPFKLQYLQDEEKNESKLFESQINMIMPESIEESSYESLLSKLRNSVTSGSLYAAVTAAFLAGNTDENSITDVLFYARHPTRDKKDKLKPHETELIKEWKDIQNNVRSILQELRNKKKTLYPTLGGLQPDKPIGFAPEPLKLPIDKPVEFAPEPTGTCYWPVISTNKNWDVVSYKYGPNKNDVIRGINTEREFYASRYNENVGYRFHAAIDVYANAGDPVVACEDGIFLYAIENFLGDTSAIYIEHQNVIVVYGEIKHKSWETFKLKIGDSVKAGQVIGEVGITPGGSSMLHFETWGLGLKNVKYPLSGTFRSWKKGGDPPPYVLNPTKYLLHIKHHGLRKSLDDITSSRLSKLSSEESIEDKESIFSKISDYVTSGSLYAAVTAAFLAGNTDENSITDVLFYARHPTRDKKDKLKPHETELIKEWQSIRNEVRNILTKLKQISTLPLVLAGPIVRQATIDSIYVWIAVSQEIEKISAHIIPYDNKGQILSSLTAAGLKEIQVQSSGVNVIRLGKKIWIALCKITPMLGRIFPTDTILGYDLSITTKGDKGSNTSVLSNLGLQLGYEPLFHLPTFVIGKLNTTIVHGSCRRPGASGEDAFKVFDDWMSETAGDVIKRPASLFLTGDQIYADDVATPLFEAVHKIASDIFGYVEKIPNYFPGYFSVDDLSWYTKDSSIPDILVDASLGGTFGKIYSNTQETLWSGRKKLTNLSTSNIGFTTDDGDAHLLSFPEYASMYLTIWNPVLCKAYGVDNGSVEELKDYDLSVQACRRVMANCATYMLCDDHDVTDDWNLDKTWEEKTKSHKTARRIISNALAAYWCFQAWGNDPYAFGESFKKSISEHLDSMWKNNGVPTTAIADNFENTLLGMHWSFMAQSNPKALCVDTRTRRTFPPGKTAILSGPEVWPYLDSLRERHGFQKNDVLLLVLPTPFLPHRTMMWAQSWYHYPSQRYEGDFELYGNNPSQRPDFINYLKANFGPSAVVILSGDVHHGSIVSGEYGQGTSPVEIWSGKSDWKIPVVQITSSPIKNINKHVKKYGNAGESLITQWERQYSTIKEGSYIAMRAHVQKLNGNLGHETFIFENHLCLVEMPSKPGGIVSSKYIGVKEGKRETAINSIDLKDVFSGVELPPYIGPAIFLK